MKFDSLTVLDYIKTSIEILMQMKLDEDKTKDPEKDSKLNKKPSTVSVVDQQNETPMSSTIKSLELPPKEYE